MSQLIKIDEEYAEWIQSVGTRFKSMQVKAATKVNQEMLRFYWSLGKDMVEMHAESRWGSKFYDSLSKDLVSAMPDQKSFSPRNLRYMAQFYQMYSKIAPQAVAQTDDDENLPHVVAKLDSDENSPQLVDELCSIPWGHHRYIIDKCKGNTEKALFYVRKTIDNNWSRAVLLNWLDTDLYERQGKAITNFDKQLSVAQGDLANELTKDPYNFDFFTMTEGYNEKELKDALTDNIVKFLLELGNGFAFVGREYRLEVGKTEQFVDLLFYNIRLHCYVVIEIKTEKFKPSDIGQVGTYVVAVNHILKTEQENPTIGLIICKEKDEVLAQYAVESAGGPIGISEYELSKVYPADFKSSLPTIAEIEQQLRD